MNRFLGWTSVAAMLLMVAGCNETQTPSTTGGEAVTVNKPVVQDADAASDEATVTVAAIGEAAPAWVNLAGVDDKQHSLQDLADAKAVVVIFTCNRCPVAVDYEDRLIELTNDYKDQGVEVVAINVNPGNAEALPAMKERAEEKGFTFAYITDPSQESARAYGATVTPHVYLLDQDRKVAYMGAIDNNQDATKVDQHHLRDAIDAVLAGNQPEVTTTKQFGCGIKYE